MAAHLEKLSQQFTKPAEKPLAERFVHQAETLYRSYVGNNAADEWELVSFLGRQGRIDEALNLLDRTWNNCKPAVLARACSSLAQKKMGQEQLERLSRLLQTAVKRFNRPVPLLMAMADVCCRRSRYADAEDLYREVIQKNSDDTNAMISLATLLARQGIQLDKSLKLVNRAIDIVGPVGTALDARARVYLALGETDKAIADIASALAENEVPTWLFHQAQACEQAGRHDEAAAAMEKALHMPVGLTKEMLYPLEFASFEKLSRLVPQTASSGGVRGGPVEASPSWPGSLASASALRGPIVPSD